MAKFFEHLVFFAICILSSGVQIAVNLQLPSSLRRGQFYPTKGESDPINSEALQCRSIRDVIKRNTARYRKVLVRNDNSMIDFGSNDDNKYMTSRAKSKLDVLASRVQAKWGRLKVDKAWTDVVGANKLSLHYEGRTLKVRLSANHLNTESNLGQLCGMALVSGFDWVYFEGSNYIRISVIPDVCQTKLDMAFVIDSSGSVGIHNFNKVKNFLKDIVDYYNVGFDQTRIALITYSYRIRVEFLLNKYGTKSEIKSAIDRMYYEGSVTATGSALLRMKDYVFSTAYGSRNDKAIPKIGILITDGKSNSGYNVPSAASQVKAAGINMFVIGIGSNLNRGELSTVASDPVSEHLFFYGFNDLSGFVDQMSTTSCDEGAQLSQCESAETYVDGGSFKYFRGSFGASTIKVTIELEDIAGKSFLYTSTENKNPGPLDKDGTRKNTNAASPKATSVTLKSNKLVYIAVQGQDDRNRFILNIWDSLFDKDTYLASVKENLPANHFVQTIRTTDSGTFQYSIKFGNNLGHFKINRDTGEIRTTKSLDREAVAKYNLVIIAADVNLRCHKGRTELVVEVSDENDHRPKFDRNPYQFTIPENMAVNHNFGLVSATDKDVGPNGQLKYYITSGQRKDDFYMDPNTGRIKVARSLDFENDPGYSFRIRVEDGGNPKKYDEGDLVINLQDINEPPRFADCVAGCSERIDEGNTLSRFVKQVSATDPDKHGCTLKYYITSSDKDYFAIGETNGRITTKKAIDRETKEVYELQIIVRDCASPSLTDRVTVSVTANDINDNAPRFPVAKYVATVNENKPTGTTVTSVRATDADLGVNARITYTISGGNNDAKFTIDSNSGRIATTGALDRETKDKYELTVTATDGGSPRLSSSVQVEIIVGDLNDNDPEFEGGRNFQVTENSRRGTLVGLVKTKDRDTGANGRIRCSITGGNSGNAFSMNPATCKISTVGIIDRETKASYNLLVKAADLGQPSRSKQTIYTVSIGDENDNSPIFASTTFRASIKENSAINSQVVKVSATDKDAGTNSQIAYSIVSGDDNSKKFSIDRQSGQIKLIGVLSFGVRNSYNLRVQAQDGATSPRSGQTNVIITIVDTNDHDPVFNPASYSRDVPENAPGGSAVLTVRATDHDSGPSGEIFYLIDSGNINNVFVINSQTGAIQVNKALDRETKDSYALIVKAKDSGSPSRFATASVTIRITDVNDNKPKFNENPFTFRLAENAASQTQIGQITATDKDIGVNADLEFKSLTTGSPITVEPNGIVKVSGKLDYEATKKYTLNVQVSDRGNPKLTDTSTIIVEVQDVNDNAPVFKGPFTCEILENSPSSTTTCYVVATDADSGENARIRYSIAAAAASGACPFNIESSTGKVLSTRSLDRETSSTYSCIVTATDSGQPAKSSQQSILVTVKDENDNAPIANPVSYKFNITEEQTKSLNLGSIMASDRDSGENQRLTYTLIANQATKVKFLVDAVSGAVSATGKLDREIKSSFSFVVRVSDNGQPSLYIDTKVDVNVNDINDNAPIFGRDPYTGSIRENSAAGSKIVQVTATDADAGSNAKITYEITGGMYKGNFSIDTNTGFITTAQPLDYEKLAKYELTILAKDGGFPQKSSTVKVSVNVINVDDNAPEFGKTSEAKVSEGAVIGTAVVKFNATDRDGGTLTFSIKGGNTGDAFRIDSRTGILKTKISLDRESIAKYNLTVAASDASGKTTNAHLPVKVTDINDNAPAFGQNSYSGSIRENQISGYSILKVAATDRDEGTNAEIEYEIESGITKDAFKIEANGDLKTTRALDRESHSSHQLVIAAKDKGTPSLRSTVPVTVTVTDQNDNTPKFDQVPAKQITENCGVGATITVVRANDPDDGLNGQVKYELISEDGATPTTFEIGETNGVVKTKVDLDREKKNSYSLKIRASDRASGTQKRWAEETLSITVLDENDNNPALVHPAAIPEVSENVTLNTVIATLRAEDKDEGLNAQVGFAIVSGNTGDVFSINADSGALKVVKSLDREQIPSYTLAIKVEDKGKPSLRSTKTYTVNLKDVNDNGPKFTLTKYRGRIAENVPVGADVVNVTATDADAGTNAVVNYTFSSQTTAATFNIDTATGRITTAGKIDYEVKQSYKFKVKASDGKFDSEADVEIEVINLNDNSPKFEREYTVAISESRPVSSSVTTVKANDLDSFGALSYSLLNNTSSFAIDTQTGEIKTTVGLDRETTSNYIIRVKVVDGGLPQRSDETTVTVNVEDINDNAPYFNRSSDKVDVVENKNVNSFYSVQALDKDAGVNAQLFYEIVTATGSNNFRIDSSRGAISTARHLDREATSSYTLSIIAKDKGKPSLTSQPFLLSITVTDQNDNSPQFLKRHDNETISEGAGIGTEVFEVLTNDLDIGMNAEIVYSIGTGNTGHVFKIDNTTGVVSVNGKLDRETTSRYLLEVTATDLGTPARFNTTTATIAVTDVNDNSPEFVRSTLSGRIFENKPVGTSVVTVRATDKDIGENARLSFSLNANDAFKINAQTGEVKTLKTLDREEKAQYNLEVTATDHGAVPLSTTETLRITIDDEDDNCPVFNPKVYNITIEENLPRGTIVLNVTATDLDVGFNAELQYAIKAGDDQGGFAIDSTTGSIRIDGTIDREYSDKYLLKVRAGRIDCGQKQTNDSNIGEGGSEQTDYNHTLAYVHIHLTDKNDNPPKFARNVFYHDFDSMMAKNLMNVTASDPDLGDGGKVKFRMLSSKRADLNGKERREVVVEASDLGNPPMTSNTTVIIRNKKTCKKMSFEVTESGALSTTTLCSFKEYPTGVHNRLVGESFSLTCIAEGNDQVSYRWSRDGNSIAAFTKKGVLEIAKVTKNDQGTYECLARNGAGTASAPTKAKLIVKEKPSFLSHPSDMTAEVGGIISLQCKATGDPAPRYQWRKDGEIFQAGEGYNTDTLTLDGVIPNDAGQYYCEAINAVGRTQSKTVVIKVVELGSIVALSVSVNNPKINGRCHYFVPEDFEKLIGDLTNMKISVTKYDFTKFCNVSNCEPNPCRNNGKCELTSNSFHCSCKGGWSGKTCELDVNECNSSIANCLTGKCSNAEGSYWCNCPSGNAGRSCEYKNSICKSNPCGSEDLCLPLPQGTTTNHTCVAKKQKFVSILKKKKNTNWESHLKFDVEDDLNQALQNWKPTQNLFANHPDFRPCSIRVTKLESLDGDRVQTEYYFICPGDSGKQVPGYSRQLCDLFIDSTDNSESCQIEGGPLATLKPGLALPPVQVTLELVAKNKNSGKTIDAKKAIDAIKQKDVRDKLAKSKIEIEGVDLAYVDRNTGEKEDDDSNVAVVVAVVCVVAFIAVAAVAAFIALKRRNQGNLNTNLTMTERIAQRGNSKEDLLRSDITMSNIDQVGMKNMAYSGDVDYRASHVPIDESFMIDVSGQMKKGAETKKPEQYESLPWYKGQMTEKQVECSFELCNKSGSYLAYKTEDDQLRLGIKTVEDSEHGVLHLGVDRTPNGAFIVKYGNNDPITRDSLLDVIEHYQVVPLSLGDGTPEIVLTEPWLRSSL